MATDNKTLVRQLTEEVWNTGNLDQVDQLVANNLVSHDPNLPIANGPQGLKQHVKQIRTAFPDLRVTIENTISDGVVQQNILQPKGRTAT